MGTDCWFYGSPQFIFWLISWSTGHGPASSSGCRLGGDKMLNYRSTVQLENEPCWSAESAVVAHLQSDVICASFDYIPNLSQTVSLPFHWFALESSSIWLHNAIVEGDGLLHPWSWVVATRSHATWHLGKKWNIYMIVYILQVGFWHICNGRRREYDSFRS